MYENFYNLSARPFQLMPDPRLLFESRDHKRALSYLLYGLERHEGFVVITGDVGMGKTLLVQTLLDELRTRNLAIARVAMANLDAKAVLPTVASAFGLPHKSRSKIELLDALVARLMPTQTSGALLIVDEAQTCNLEALEELRAISNLQADGRALLQVFLVGQTDLRDSLSAPVMAHLRQRIVASHHLQPLDADEGRAYIRHRLEMVGWEDVPHFSEDVYSVAHRWSRGVPRRLNLLMDRFLLYGYLEQRVDLSGEDLRVVISEFEDEFAGDDFAFGNAPNGAATNVAAVSNQSLDALNERIAGIEQALRNAFGDTRAAELMDKHQARMENREVLAAQMRIARLEGLLEELVTQGEPVFSPRQVALDEQQPEADEVEDFDAEASESAPTLADAIDAITPASLPQSRKDDMEDARWRLFSRRRKGEH